MATIHNLKTISWVTEVHDLIADGESSFWKAAVVMQRQIDEGMSQRDVAKELGRSKTWVQNHLKWLGKEMVSDTDHLVSKPERATADVESDTFHSKKKTPFSARVRKSGKPATITPIENPRKASLSHLATLRLNDMPSEEEAEAEHQESIYDQVCLYLEMMTDATRQRIFAHIRSKYHED